MAPRLLLCALIVAAYLFVCRWLIAYYANAPSDFMSAKIVAAAVERFGMDALAVAVVTGAALIIARLSATAATIVLVVASAYLMIAGAVNVRVMDVYQQPATVNLLSYGDFLNLAGLRSLTKYVTWIDKVLIVSAFACVAAFAAVPRLQRSRLFASPWPLAAVSAVVLVALPAYGLLQASEETRRRHANAGWWLLQSAITPAAAAGIDNPDLGDPFQTYAVDETSRITTAEHLRRSEIRNVVIVVLESVGSEYLDLRRSPELAPNLSRLLSKSAYFPNAYAPMPSSPAALFSLMTGMYPPVSPVAIPMAEPDFPATTLLESLRAGGRRTGVFSANWGFMDFATYLRESGADQVEEVVDEQRCGVRSPGGAAARNDVSGEAEECTFASMRRWIAGSPDNFAAILWTYGTHFPYGADPAELAADPRLGRARYLAGIRRTDRLVGDLALWLEAQGRLETTLLVVVGDHGESFFQHGNRAHGNDVHDEAVRVPLMLINSRLFSGVTDTSPVRLIDVPPTVLSLAGAPVPATFQGLDLTSRLRPRRVFFAAAWLNLVLGFREGRTKYNYVYVTDQLQAFDLARDPGEMRDRAAGIGAGERDAAVHRIINWKSAVDTKIAAARTSAG